MDLGLTGRRAMVSGATQGIGQGVVDALAAEGVELFLVARDPDRLAETAREMQDRHAVRCRWRSADFAVAGEAADAARAAEESLGDVDILVNNAGRSMPASLDTSASEWAASQQLNMISHLEAIRTVLPGMVRRGRGRVVNVTGAAYRAPTALNSGTIAKYGLVNAAKTLSREVAGNGVTINTVTVGLIGSHQIDEIHFPDPQQRAELAGTIPMGRFGRPDEVAAAVTFLASEQASYVTGSTITVDGGADPTLL